MTIILKFNFDKSNFTYQITLDVNKFKNGIKWFLLAILMWFIYVGISIHDFSHNYCETNSHVAIVLGAGSSNGKLSLIFKERVNHALLLYKSKLVDKIIFTGGFGEGESISDSQSALEYAIENGVSKQDIYLEEKSTITYENLIFADSIMKANNLETTLIVSDPYHMCRSMAMCAKLDMNAKPSPTQTSMYKSCTTKFPSLIYETFYYNIDLLLGHI